MWLSPHVTPAIGGQQSLTHQVRRPALRRAPRPPWGTEAPRCAGLADKVSQPQPALWEPTVSEGATGNQKTRTDSGILESEEKGTGIPSPKAGSQLLQRENEEARGPSWWWLHGHHHQPLLTARGQHDPGGAGEFQACGNGTPALPLHQIRRSQRESSHTQLHPLQPPTPGHLRAKQTPPENAAGAPGQRPTAPGVGEGRAGPWQLRLEAGLRLDSFTPWSQ